MSLSELSFEFLSLVFFVLLLEEMARPPTLQDAMEGYQWVRLKRRSSWFYAGGGDTGALRVPINILERQACSRVVKKTGCDLCND